MKVLTQNIRCCDDACGNAIGERAPRLRLQIMREDPDLIGFQEATPVWMEYIQKDFGERYEIFNQYRAKNSLESTPILWKKEKFECLDKGCFWLSDTPDEESQGWDSIGCPRVCLWISLRERTTGKRFLFMNTHFGFSDACQIGSAELVAARADAQNADAVVITGDFNMTSGSAGYRSMTDRFVDVNAVTDRDFGITYHGYGWEKNQKDCALIDFCFVSPDSIEPIGSRVLRDTIDGRYPSDHFGVLSEMELR